MKLSRFQQLMRRYSSLRLALVGDFCLDRYFEIDPARQELSIETGLPVHNVMRIRSQPGGAGTILNNLAALGIGQLYPVGFCGDDGEGVELLRAIKQLSNVNSEYFLQTPLRHTFTYGKPLLLSPGEAPVELSRLDIKNWTPTPNQVSESICGAMESLSSQVDGIMLLEQVDIVETGVITRQFLDLIDRLVLSRPQLAIVADSRRGLQDYPPVTFKMNARELASLAGETVPLEISGIGSLTANLAGKNGRPVVVTLAEKGILGALPDGSWKHLPAFPVRGEIDIVGAGDAVSANLTAALAAGASLFEALELANAAASVVIHQLGTTGTATPQQLQEVIVDG
jgi:rfaE bifunctional protein kinase chain/domain